MVATTTYTIIDCPECHVLFGITEQYEARMRERGHSFYCPSGHSMSYGDSLREQLEREKDKTARLNARIDQVRAERDRVERQRRATKGALTKVKNRVSKGVCPCCNRTFADLARHMESKHPTYAATSEAVSPTIGTAA